VAGPDGDGHLPEQTARLVLSEVPFVPHIRMQVAVGRGEDEVHVPAPDEHIPERVQVGLAVHAVVRGKQGPSFSPDDLTTTHTLSVTKQHPKTTRQNVQAQVKVSYDPEPQVTVHRQQSKYISERCSLARSFSVREQRDG